MSVVETGQMSAVETGQMSAVEKRQVSSAETRQMSSGKKGRCLSHYSEVSTVPISQCSSLR